MGEKIKDRQEVDNAANGYVIIFTKDPVTGEYSPGEKIEIKNLLSTGSLTSSGIVAWQSLIKQALASDTLRSLANANAYTQTADNGVYLTAATTTNLPDTNKVGTLEVLNAGTTKYLRYQTFNSGRIEIWTNYYNGTSWGEWNYANGESALSFADGIFESGGVVRMGGELSDDVIINLAGFKKQITGNDSEFEIQILNTGSGASSVLSIGNGVLFSFGSFAIQIDTDGITLSQCPVSINQRTLPNNDAQQATGNSVYATNASTLNLPATVKTGILESFDHENSGNLSLRYTTFLTGGLIQVWGRKKLSGSWYAWALLAQASTDAVWGGITGDPEDQSDLMDMFDLKADLVDGKVPSDQLPSYVDDVIEVANYAELPGTGETGKIYVTLDTNFTYRWSGSAYIKISDYDLASAIHAADSKATPVDNDELGIWDSVAQVLKKLTWSNLKATLKTYFDTLYIPKTTSINLINANYNLQASDNKGIIELGSSSFTLTLTQQFAGFSCDIMKIGSTGTTTIAAGSGVAIGYKNANRKMATQHEGVSIYFRSTTDVEIVGPLTA